MNPFEKVRSVRPYQLLEVVADAGAGTEDSNPLLAAIRQAPDLPLCLRANAGEVFAWQDPGPAEDSPGGAEFNLRRDLEVLQKLDLFPGAVLPARVLLNRVLDRIPDLDGIAVYGEATSAAWRGCPPAYAAGYARGRERGMAALVPPRSPEELGEQKRESMALVLGKGPVKVRPHILLCAVCQYGGGTRPPYPEDNLPELLSRVIEKGDVTIELAPHADWDMCAPCPYRSAAINACVNNKGAGGISNEVRDLRVLQKLGLVFGDRMEGRALFRRILERIPGTKTICKMDALAGSASVWLTGCGLPDQDSENYAKGRRELLALLPD